jgi:3',5'-cyclic AMP phosphodiesterase CpdA
LDDSWTRIEKDLYLGKGWVSNAYVHVQQKKEEKLLDSDKVVLDVRVGRLDPSKSDKEQENAIWESRQGGLWLLRSSKPHAGDSHDAITAVDVLFGADAVDPRPGWQVKNQGLLLDTDRSTAEPRLSVRRGQPKSLTKVQPRIRKDGNFKILQVSDMHLSTGLGACRDEFPATSHCDADPRTLEFVSEVLDSEKPDLVVLSGDQVNGETAPDSQSAMLKMAELFISRSIPYALIFGNHDDEGSLSRPALMELAESLPFSLSEAGPATVDGTGNYVVEILAHGTSHHSAISLYMLDTHSYSPDETRYKGYDWLKPSQISWFRETARSLHSSSAHKDYAHIHLDMAFIHIPLPEYRIPENKIPDSGDWREPPTAPGFNSGFKDALVENGIFAVSCGHDHVNDYCTIDGHSKPSDIDVSKLGSEAKSNAEKGRLWMCYAGGSGYGGYGGYGGYKRRVRIWEFHMNEGDVETWKRIDGEEGRTGHKKVVRSGRVLGADGS